MQAKPGLGTRIKEIRQVNNLNRREFGAKVGTSGTTIKNIEEGDTLNPSANLLASIANSFGVSFDWILNGIGEGPETIQHNSASVSDNKIKGNSNAVGIGNQVQAKDIQAENERLNLEIKHLTDKVKTLEKDKENLLALLMKK